MFHHASHFLWALTAKTFNIHIAVSNLFKGIYHASQNSSRLCPMPHSQAISAYMLVCITARLHFQVPNKFSIAAITYFHKLKVLKQQNKSDVQYGFHQGKNRGVSRAAFSSGTSRVQAISLSFPDSRCNWHSLTHGPFCHRLHGQQYCNLVNPLSPHISNYSWETLSAFKSTHH